MEDYIKPLNYLEETAKLLENKIIEWDYSDAHELADWILDLWLVLEMSDYVHNTALANDVMDSIYSQLNDCPYNPQGVDRVYITYWGTDDCGRVAFGKRDVEIITVDELVENYST